MEKKHINRRDFLRLAGLAAGSAIVAACSPGGATTQAPSAGGATQGATQAPSAGGAAITLSHWYHQYGEEGTQQAVMRYAEEYHKVKPNVTVNVNWTPGDYGAKLNAALLTAEGPDVFESQINADRVKQGQLATLDDLFTEDLKKDFGSVIQQMTWQGHIYAVKMINDTAFIYYKKSLLDKAGVKPPTTADELIDVSKKLNQGGVKGLFIGNDGYGPWWNLGIWSTGETVVDGDKVGWTVDRVAKVYEKARDLYKSDSLLIGAPADWWDPSALTTGLCAMQYCGLWAMPAIVKALGDDVGILPWPKLDDQGRPATFLGGWAEFVSTKSKNVDEAKALVKWMWIDNKDIQTDWATAYGFHIPPRASATAAAAKLQSGLAAEGVKIAKETGQPELLPTWTSDVTTPITDALGNIVLKNADAKTELDAAHKKSEDALKKLLG